MDFEQLLENTAMLVSTIWNISAMIYLVKVMIELGVL